MNGFTRHLSLVCGALLLLRAPRLFAEPSTAAVAAFNTYAHTVEARLAQQHSSPDTFLILPADPTSLAHLRSGQLLIEKINAQLTTPTLPDALLHHWRATAFVPNAGVPGDPKGRWGGNVTASDFAHLLQDFNAYPRNFAPQIVSTTVLSRTPTDTIARLRTRQHHVLTVVLDTTVDVTFATLDPTHGYSISRSTRVDQISPSGDDGFLYRLNTYWTYEQRDGGLYLQIESVSLTRNIPHGLAWAIQPYLESIPRESLVFTLTSARNALQLKN
jgi:ribosome-associated toxin RatA of RatAB toxin-antitoxin module